MKTSDGLDEIKTVTQKLCDMYAENKDIVYYSYNNPNIVNGMLADLYITRKTFAAQGLHIPRRSDLFQTMKSTNFFKEGQIYRKANIRYTPFLMLTPTKRKE